MNGSSQHIERLRQIIPQPLRNGNASYFVDAQAIGAHDAIDRLEEQLEAAHAALVAADTFWAKPDTGNARRAQSLVEAILEDPGRSAATQDPVPRESSAPSERPGASSPARET